MPDITVTAQEAELALDHTKGVLSVVLRNATVDVGGKVTYRDPEYLHEIPVGDAGREEKLSSHPSNLALGLIPEGIVGQKQRIELCEQQMAARAAYQMLCGDFGELTGEQWEARARDRSYAWGRLYRLLTEPHRRWSAGFSCLCFAWVGAPMAIRLRNREFLTSFFLCFLPILIVYYPLLAAAVDGAKGGTLPPCGVWAGNVLLLCWGAWLLRRVIRY